MLDGLVAADMDVFRREHFRKFCKNTLDKIVRFFFSRAKYFAVDSEFRGHFHGLFAAPELGIRRNRSAGMSRYIELGNYRDKSFFCKLDDVFYLFLGVKTAVGFLIAAGFTAHRTVLGKARVFVNLNAPALIVGQMPMEHVEFKKRNCLDILFHDFDREKVSDGVEHISAVRKTRLVVDFATRNLRRFRLFVKRRKDQLFQRLRAVKKPAFAFCGHLDAVFADNKRIRFGRTVGAVGREFYILARTPSDTAGFQKRRNRIPDVFIVAEKPCFCVEQETAVFFCKFFRTRNNSHSHPPPSIIPQNAAKSMFNGQFLARVRQCKHII